MSETPKSTPTAKPDAKSAAPKAAESTPKSDTAKTSDGAATTASNGDAGKSSRESIGGSAAVHYGFFSNVKTPEYRSGWDDIWSNKSGTRKKQPARAREPVVISLTMDDLPEALQAGLAEVARARLKKSRINYDNRARAGAVTWHIGCEVKR